MEFKSRIEFVDEAIRLSDELGKVIAAGGDPKRCRELTEEIKCVMEARDRLLAKLATGGVR